MKLLAVTGASGFIGRRIVAAALQAGWAVRAITRSPGSIPASPNLTAMQWDIGSPFSPQLLENCDGVCHAAAFRPDDLADDRYAAQCMHINAEGTLNVLRAAHTAGARRFVYMSGGNAYAPGKQSANESVPLFPAARATYYLASKLAGELYAAHWDATDKLSCCILRASSVYGPGMNEGSLIPSFIRKLSAGEKLSIKNGGCAGADMVYVDDVAAVTIASLDAKFRGPVNVGSGTFSSTRDIATALTDILKTDPGLVSVEPFGKQDASFVTLDITTAKREMGYVPTSLYDGLTRYVNSRSDSAQNEIERPQA